MIRTEFLVTRFLVAAALVAAMLLFGPVLRAAPPPRPAPTWLLQNGVWVPLVAPGQSTPEAQVALMVQNLNTGHYSRVVHQAKRWLKNKSNKTNPLAPEVLLLRGDACNAKGDKYAALFPYEDLLDNFPNSPLYGPCLEREYNIACAFLRGYKRRFLGMRILPVGGDALRLLRRIQDRQRGSPLAELAGIRVADYYYHEGRFRRALQSYKDFLRRYPYSQFVIQASIREIECLLGTFHGVRFDMTPLHNAEAELETLSRRYPRFAAHLQVKALEERIYQLEGEKELQIARFYVRFSHPHAAEYYYRRVMNDWPDTIWAKKARHEFAAHFGKGNGR